jgi:hypothetical protein
MSSNGQISDHKGWKLDGERGGCVVQLGMKRAEVHERCGRPVATGTQPIVPDANRSNPSILECSAPCDRYGSETLFYGCDSAIEVVGKPAKDGTCVDVAPGRESGTAFQDIREKR